MFLSVTEEAINLQLQDQEMKGTDEEDIKSRPKKICIRPLHALICNKNFEIETNKITYHTIVQNLMTYIAEVWVINERI